jgi:MerR family redox-sensitive transcriptional activator SoxR
MRDNAASPVELTVGQVAQRSGVAVSTLHFYESQGLITSRRTAGNQRRYPREVLRRVAFIRVSQGVGIPLRRIKTALDQLPDGRTPTRGDWERLSQAWRDDLDDQISRLQQLRDNLSGCIGCGCLSLDRCTLMNPDDILGRQGPGPRNLEPQLSGEPPGPCPAPEPLGTARMPEPGAVEAGRLRLVPVRVHARRPEAAAGRGPFATAQRGLGGAAGHGRRH